jgi:CheY-like chemotaxis protein
MNINIIRAKNGDEAVNICLANENIDLVLMDIKMPVLNGLDATKKILESRRNLPIIAQSAGAFSDNRQKALEYGCADFVSKPIKIDELINKMSNLLMDSDKKKILA